MRRTSGLEGWWPRGSIIAGVVLGLFSACAPGEVREGLGPDADDISALIVTPNSITVGTNQQIQFAAYGLTQNGDSLPVAVEWSATGGTIEATGAYHAGATAGNFAVTAAAAGRAATATVVIVPPGSGPLITVVPAVALQTMRGWEATAQAGQDECDPVAFANYRDPLYDRVVTELGINRLRLEFRSGVENPRDGFAELVAGTIDRGEWRNFRYAAINDNGDPTSVNPAGFHFTEMDRAIDNVVTPIRNRLLARGEALYVTLTYVDFSGQGAGTLFHKEAPAEYAELLHTAFQHIQSRYGWVPDAVEMVLEPDNAVWSGTQIGAALVAAGDRLAAAGYRPDFIAPSNSNMGRAITWFDELVAVPRVTQYLTDLAYHRYGGVSTANLQALSARAVAFGIRAGMLEHKGSGYQDLHQDLTLGRNSTWQQYILGWCDTADIGGRYYLVDVSTPTAPVISLASRTRFLQQYFRDVRFGAVRHEAVSTSGTFAPVAFRNTTGRWVVVVKASAGGTFSVAGLPAGTYGLTYTTSSTVRTALPDATISAGQPLIATIPASGVLTVAAQ